MATFTATFYPLSAFDDRAVTGSTMMILPLSAGVRLANLTTSATSQIVQLSGSDWSPTENGVVAIFCDGAVNIAAAPAPTAAATAGQNIPANIGIYPVVIAAGEKLAVINA